MYRFLKNNTSLAFEYGNPWRLGVFGVIAVILGWQQLYAYYFLIKMYRGERVLDVPSNEFYLPLLIFILVSFCAGYIMRSIIIHLRLKLLFRRQLVVAEYQKPANLTAVEAGYLIDRSWSQNEVDATIAELVLTGVVRKHNGSWHLTNNQPETFTAYYHALFLELTFQNDTAINEARLRSSQLSQRVVTMIHHSLTTRGYLNEDFLTTKLLPFFRICLYAALAYGVATTVYIAENGMQALSTNHGEIYPLHVWQLIAGLLIPLTLAGTAISGFFVKINPLVQKTTDRRYIAGLKLYLKTVFTDRLGRYGKTTADEKFLRNLYPYMVAFGIANLDT